jgi:hypothetical protein
MFVNSIANSLSALRKRFVQTSLLGFLCILTSCQYLDLPEYWLCRGQHLQIVQGEAGEILEKYRGNQKLMLEIYNSSVSQFASPAAFGKYDVCLRTSHLILFEHPQCQDKSSLSNRELPYRRWGALDIRNGIFAFVDERVLKNVTIRSGGTFECRYLGYSYAYDDMLLDND